MSLPPYRKPFLSISDQIALLQRRGMVVRDVQQASAHLERLGYYRLSGYWYPMRRSIRVSGQARVLDDFQPGTDFDQVIALYNFDKRLRLLMLDGIERIEVGLRVRVALELGVRDPFAHRKPAELHANFQRPGRNGVPKHQSWVDKLDELTSRSNAEFVEHFDRTYAPPLPIWIAIELWDFGLLSTLLAGIKWPDALNIAVQHGIPRPDLLQSWARSINYVRNVCAHHARLWNHPLVVYPAAPRHGEVPLLDHIVGDTHAQTRLYGTAAIIQLLARAIDPTSRWADELKAILPGLPAAPGVSLAATGFPNGWGNLSLWQ